MLFVVVVAQEVEDSVDDQEGGFPLDGVVCGGGLSEGLGEADYHVAQVWGFVGGRGKGGGCFVRCGFSIVMTLPRAGMAGGESQDVGDRVSAAVLSVESADCVVVAEG